LKAAASRPRRRHTIEIQPSLEPKLKAALRQALRAALDHAPDPWRIVVRSALVYETREAGSWWWSIALISGTGAVQILLVRPDEQAPASVGKTVSKAVLGELLMALCSACKRVRAKNGSWHRRALPKDLLHVTHGICPECAARLYPDIVQRLERKRLAP